MEILALSVLEDAKNALMELNAKNVTLRTIIFWIQKNYVYVLQLTMWKTIVQIVYALKDIIINPTSA